jgi:glycosyltransferase involved in cell wall biosynthesis
MQLSVIICTHNPRRDYLQRTLDALEKQSLPKDEWELLLVDNASKSLLSDEWSLFWHPNARHMRENQLGLTAARMKGILEARSELLVFVDDDNVLEKTFLESTKAIAYDMPFLGAWGGRIDPEFEVPPPAEINEFLGMLAIRPVSEVIWSNDIRHGQSQPWGAGMCVRKEVAILYLRNAKEDPVRKTLGRIGSSLSSCEDTDLVMTCPELGLGFGLFPQLQLLHLIGSARLTEDYLIRLHEGITTSTLILKVVRGIELLPVSTPPSRRLINFIKFLRMDRLQRRVWNSEQRAIGTARKVCEGFV